MVMQLVTVVLGCGGTRDAGVQGSSFHLQEPQFAHL